jgi:hypothetical protein
VGVYGGGGESHRTAMPGSLLGKSWGKGIGLTLLQLPPVSPKLQVVYSP